MIRLLIIIYSLSAVSQNINRGIRYYKAAQFNKAERELYNVYKTTRANSLKIKSLKYMGISQYMQGRKSSAQKTFQILKKMSPRTKISPNDVLDESVIAFFNNIKTKTAKKRVKSRKTTVKIKSNTKGSLTIDGILAGNTGEILEVEPGKQTVIVTARGYKSRKVRINVVKSRYNEFTLNLTKPTPKPVKRKPKKNLPPAMPKPGAVEDLFDGGGETLPPGRDLASEFAADGVQRPPVQPQGYGLQRGQPPVYTPPPPQYGYPQQPVYPPPQPYYQQPYPTQPYGYAPPPEPVQDMYQPTPPVADPYYDGGRSEEFLDSKPYKKKKRNKRPRRKKSKRRSSSKSNGNGTLISLLPFGAGQFYNGDYFLGSLFAASQIGAIAFSIYSMNEANSAVSTLDEYLNRDTSGESEEEADANSEAFSKDSTAYIAEKRQQQNLGLYAFFGLWAIGSIEAILNAPSSDSYGSVDTKYPRTKVAETRYNGVQFGLMVQNTKTVQPAVQFQWNW